MTPSGSPPVAARLDRLPIAGFHRDMVKRLAYIFFFELGDLNSFAFAAPGVRQAWHLSIDTTSAIISASFIGMFVGATTGGWFSDQVGRKRALVVTTVWYSGFSLMNAFAWSVPTLFATRLLTGVGLSAMTVVAMTYISEMFPARARGAYQARILTIGLIGIPVTAYVARFLIPMASWGWRAVFVWGSCAILFPLFAGKLEESPRWYENQGRHDEADASMTRIEQRVRQEVGELPPVPAGWTASIARQGGFGELVRSGSLGRAFLLIGIWICQTLGIYGFLSWVPTLLVEHGFSVVGSLERSSAMSIGAVPGAWIAAKISDRWERKSLIAIVAVVIAACGMSYGLSFRTTTIVIFGFLVAMSQQVFAALLYAYTPECFPTAARNTGAGLAYGVGRLANAFGPLLVAWLFKSYGYSSVFEYIAICWALVAILVTVFGPKTRGQALV
jgi:MFS transporter, putative metabolite:H+ symporter